MDDIIRMAREAGFLPEANPVMTELLVRFAALVRAAEREACARMVDHILKEGGGTYGSAIRARAQQPPATVEDRLARHGIPMPDQPLPDDHDGNPSF